MAIDSATLIGPRSRPMTLGKLRTWLYRIARHLGDVNAVRRGPKGIAKRLGRRAAGRLAGRAMGRIFRP